MRCVVLCVGVCGRVCPPPPPHVASVSTGHTKAGVGGATVWALSDEVGDDAQSDADGDDDGADENQPKTLDELFSLPSKACPLRYP